MLTGVPDIAFVLVPELDGLRSRGEPRADCARCVMLPEQLGGDEGHPWAFRPETRCCTIHPELPNYAVGRALLRGGASAERIRARLCDRSGVTAWGVVASERYRRISRASTERLGRDVNRRCPYWIGGTYSCGVWHDRNAVCRTWFCKHDHGSVGLLRWNALRKLLLYLEIKLGRLLVQLGAPPDPATSDGDDRGRQQWEQWFVWCARRVDQLDDEDVSELDGDQFARLRGRLIEAINAPDPDLADQPVLVPVVTECAVTARGLALAGYSSYDGVEVDPDIIELFARLDGARTWQQASAGRVTDDRVRELHRAGILRGVDDVIARARDAGHRLPPRLTGASGDLPDVLTPAVQRPIVVGSRVWLQGEVPLASVIAPRTIFQLLARLDGQTRWQDALDETNRALLDAGEPPIERALVVELYDIGALRPDSP